MRRSLIALACVALIAGACGGDGPDPGDDPKAALRSALENLGNYQGVEMTVVVVSDRDSLVALSEGELREDQADTILASSVNVKSRSGEDPADAQLEIVLDIEGDLVEMKAVDQTLYVRADVRPLVERFDGDPRDIDAFVQEAPPSFDFVGPATEGEWIAMEGADRLQEQFGGAATPDAELQKKLAADLSKAVEDHSTVTSEGNEDAGHHLVANVRVRPLFESFMETLSQLPGAGIPGAGLPDASEVPDEEVRVDVWVANDQVRRVELDIGQFGEWSDEGVPAGVERMAVRIDLEEFTDEVKAPDAAASVDLQQLLQGFFGGLMPGESGEAVPEGPGSIEELCEQLGEAPAEVQEQFAEECPNLQN